MVVVSSSILCVPVSALDEPTLVRFTFPFRLNFSTIISPCLHHSFCTKLAHYKSYSILWACHGSEVWFRCRIILEGFLPPQHLCPVVRVPSLVPPLTLLLTHLQAQSKYDPEMEKKVAPAHSPSTHARHTHTPHAYTPHVQGHFVDAGDYWDDSAWVTDSLCCFTQRKNRLLHATDTPPPHQHHACYAQPDDGYFLVPCLMRSS